MSDDYSRVLNILGLAFNLIGVLILFRWGCHSMSKATVILLDRGYWRI